MKSNPHISVIMPCYNEQDNIEKSIQSILNQTFKDFELIVVDDCSTDHSRDIIKTIAKCDNRVVYLRNTSNSGVAKTLNNGLRIARGEYIARMDADDLCEPTRFQKQIEYLKSHPKCIVCGSFADVFDGTKTVIQGNVQGDLKRHLVKNNPFVHSSIIFKRIVNDRPVFYPETKGFEDYGLWIELSDDGEFYTIPEVLVHRVDMNNLATKKTWEGFTKQKVYKKLLTYQIKAIKKTDYFLYGTWCVMWTGLKIVISTIKMLPQKISGGIS